MDFRALDQNAIITNFIIVANAQAVDLLQLLSHPLHIHRSPGRGQRLQVSRFSIMQGDGSTTIQRQQSIPLSVGVRDPLLLLWVFFAEFIIWLLSSWYRGSSFTGTPQLMST